MINKENKDEEVKSVRENGPGFVDVAKMEVQCHILIKDKDTGEILVNKRG